MYKKTLEWSNPKAQGPGSERILELIVKTAIEEYAWTFSRTGTFDFKSYFKNMKLDAIQLGAHILATGKLPEASLRHFKRDSGKDLCLENRS